MNKRQKKKRFKKWLKTAIYIEESIEDDVPIDVGIGAWLEAIREEQTILRDLRLESQ